MTIGNTVLPPVGEEFLINTTTFQTQEDSSIASLEGGGFIVTWTDSSRQNVASNSLDVRAQMFHADGTPRGDEFIANTSTESFQRESNVTGLKNGGFVVTWFDGNPSRETDGSSGIYAQMYKPDGTTLGEELHVNSETTATQNEPSITALPNGGFVVVWVDFSKIGDDTFGTGIKAQIYATNGGKLGGEFLVNTTTTNSQSEPEVTALSGGGFVVSWTDDSSSGGDTSKESIRSQMFLADGSKDGTEVLVNSTTDELQTGPSVTGLKGGRFVVTWNDYSTSGGDTSYNAIRGQIVDPDGSLSGGEFLVNSTTSGHQSSPSITSLASGGFIVVWRDSSASGDDTSGTAIRGQVFNPGGTPAGEEFLANATTFQSQHDPRIVELADGRIVITWKDTSATGGDISGGAIRGQIFDPRAEGVDLQGTALADDLVGTAFDDTIKGAKGADTLVGAVGDDTLFGQGGNDNLQGDAGDDVLFGGGQKDRLYGGQGDDTLEGQAGRDQLRGSVGADLLKGGAGKDRLFGGEQKDQLFGGGGGDVLQGESGNDDLFGGGGNDKLLGGLGTDMLQGGAGADVFIFNKASHSRVGKSDVIDDFTSGDDLIDLSDMYAGLLEFVGVDSFSGTGAEVQIVKKLNGNAFVQVDVDGDGSADARIVLKGLSSAEIDALSAADFIL